ncbi:MAG: oligopeptidase B, partial [Kaistella sp.]
MKKTIAASLITVTCMMNAQSWPNAKPPVAEKQNHIREIHGEKVNDPYYWMIDYFKKGKDSTKVVNYLTAENNYLEKMMADTKQLRDQLYQEMKA